MKITIYELLGLVKDGKAPKKIKWEDQEWKYNPINDYEGIKYGGCLLNQLTLDRLNDEVEILEEEKKIPEKFKINYEIDEENTINLTPATMLECDLACRINEIIDYLDYLKSKGE